jgi:L-2,4-diaminobutyric acid acetyltransferase
MKGASTQTVQTETILRNAGPDDGAALWRLVRECRPLDENSAYAYMMWAREFSDTTLVAERDDELIGFVTAFRPPSRPDSIFLWQVGVGKAGRGEGLASRLLDALLQVPGEPVRFVEATVDPLRVLRPPSSCTPQGGTLHPSRTLPRTRTPR